MKLLHIVERNETMLHRQAFFCEAFCGVAAKYEAQLTLHEAALRAMKRSLTASCFFAHLGKKNGGSRRT